MKLRKALIAAIAIASLAAAPVATAQSWPTQSVKIIVPWATGGTVDLAARQIGQKLSDQVGKPVVVENKPGGSSTIGMGMVANAAPDGHTLVAFELTYAMLPSLFKKLSWNHATDIAPVGTMIQTPMVMVVPAASPHKTVQDLVTFARQNPGKLNFGSGGLGSTPHLSAELLKREGKLDMVHVPYKGGGEALLAVVSGNVDLLITAAPTAIGQVKSGKVRALAVTGAQRSPAFPDVPTFVESGMPGVVVSNWYGFAASKGTPKPITDRIYAEVVKAMADAELKARFAQQGAEPLDMNGEVFGRFIQEETRRWGEVARQAGVKAE